MNKMMKFGANTAILAVSCASLTACSAANTGKNLHPYQKTNQFRAGNIAKINHNPYISTYNKQGLRGRYGNNYGRYGYDYNKKSKKNKFGKFRRNNAPVILPRPAPQDMFLQWVDYEPDYTLYPGDQIDIVVETAPELSRTLTVAPDGRISMPMVGSIMAAGKPLAWIERAIESELAKQLRNPDISITNRAFAAQNIYVGGQVGQQGTYALSGPIGTMEAIIMAGGFLPSAKTRQVVVLRRHPSGGLMMRVVDHKQSLKFPRYTADNMKLRRGDIIFVPRNSLSEIGVFVQQIRGALPVDFGISYNLGAGWGGN